MKITNQINCPSCRSITPGNVDSLKKNYSLMSLLEEIRKENESRIKPINCEECDNKATVFCHQCNRSLCESHNSHLHSLKILSNHKRSDISKNPVTINNCKEHGDYKPETPSFLSPKAVLITNPEPTELLPEDKYPIDISVLNPKAHIQLQSAHNSRVFKVKYSYSGKALLSLDVGAINKIWKWGEPGVMKIPDSFPELNLKQGDVACPSSFALSSNDSYLILCINGQLELCQNVHRKKIVTLYKLEEGKPPANTVLFLPSDNNYIVVGLQTGQIMITWIPKYMFWKFDGHQACISDIVFMNNSKENGILYSSSSDGKIKQWGLQINDGRPLFKELDEVKVSLNSSATYLRVSPNSENKTQLLVFQNTQIQIWENREIIHEWKPDRDASIVDACYSARGEYIYVIVSTNYVYILTPTLSNVFCIRMNEILTTIAANPITVSMIALGTEQGHIYVTDLPIK